MILNATNSYLEGRYNPNQYMPMDPKYIYESMNGSGKDRYLSTPAYGINTDYSAGTGLDMLLGHKKDIIQSKIQMLATEIYERYRLKNDNLYRIDLDQCTCRTLIYQMGDFYLDRRRLDLEKKIIDLEQEKRREKALYFRDVSFIRKELRYSLIEQLEEEQKADLFMNQPEELPCNV